MIESVQARQRGAFNFEDHYDNLCALQDSAPLAAVKSHLAQGVIDLNGDRIRLNDWQPIINSIRINKSLQFIAVRSYYQVPSDEDEKRAAILRRKLPSIRSKEITHRLVKALKECLFVSPTLSCIELRGLALRDRDLQVLVKGILKSQALRHLSLEYCRIGDQGLDILCKGLKNTKNINSVNLSGCSLSHRGAESLAAVIKHQGMQRHNEAWRDSLRYRRPDLDRMAGIRRITANNNPMLGDEGARMLAEALKDDLWLKALDLQACGIATPGAKSFLEVLKYNTTLVVLDLRRNPLIDRDILHSVMEQLMLNSNGDDGEYKWIKAEEGDDQLMKQTAKTRRRATKVLNASLGKKTTIRVTPTSTRRKVRGPVGPGRKLDIPASPGLPWRTAARANRFRGHPPDVSRYLADPSADDSTSILISTSNNNNNMGQDDDNDDTFTGTNIILAIKDSPSSHMKRINAETAAAMRKLEESHLSMDLTNQKEVMVELEQMRRHLREERLARAKADQRVVQMMIENRRLTEEIASLQRAGRARKGGILDDESFLESIETSFKQFHAFIDMLKEAGLGQLVTMAGLDQTQMPFGNSSGNIYNNVPASSGGNNSYMGGGKSSYPTTSPSTTLPHNTTYANVPLASSAFVNGQQRATGHTRTVMPGASVSMTSFSEEAPVVIGSAEGQDTIRQPGAYTGESEAAKHEADELYSKLLKETSGALNQDSGAAARGTTYTRPEASVNVAQALAKEEAKKKEAEAEEREMMRNTMDSIDMDMAGRQQLVKGGSGLSDLGNYSVESIEEPSWHLSDRGHEGGEQEESGAVSPPGMDDSQDDDF